MLKNDYLVVKIGVDTAENGPSKVEADKGSPRRPVIPGLVLAGRPHDTSLFPRFVLVCIDTDFDNQIVILQHFSKSTRFAHFCTARNAIFWRNLSKIARSVSPFFLDVFENLLSIVILYHDLKIFVKF